MAALHKHQLQKHQMFKTSEFREIYFCLKTSVFALFKPQGAVEKQQHPHDTAVGFT